MLIHICLFSVYHLSISQSYLLAKFQRHHDPEGMHTPFNFLLRLLNLRKTLTVSLPFIHLFICISIHCRSIYLLVLPFVCSFAHQSVCSYAHLHMSFFCLSSYSLSISQSYLLASFKGIMTLKVRPPPLDF